MDAEFVDDFGGGEPSPVKETRRKLEPEGTRPASNGCFDCNICLDYAAEPVVTLCGHLYCWPCIYKWLHLESPTPQRCPVCKAALSQSTLVPLYGRGYDSKPADGAALDVPRRPSVTMTSSVSGSETPRTAAHHAHQHSYHHRHDDSNYTMSSSSSMTMAPLLHPTMLGGVAIAVLPWVLGEQGMGLFHPNPYGGGGDSPRLRRQEMQARRSLHRISIFLFCCVVLCLLVF